MPQDGPLFSGRIDAEKAREEPAARAGRLVIRPPLLAGSRNDSELFVGRTCCRSGEQCSADPEQPLETAGLNAEWVGTGTASCATSMSCVQRALSAGAEAFSPGKEAFKDLVTCVVDADPAVSKELSRFVRCAMQNEDHQRACSAESSACAGR